MSIPKSISNALRWIAVLPAAYLGAGLAQFAIILANRLTMARYVDPDSFLGELFIRTVSNMAFGASMVWIAGYVAPIYKSHVAMFTAGLFVAGSLAAWASGIGVHSSWDVYATVVGAIAAVVMCVDMAKDERVRTSLAAAQNEAVHTPFGA